MLKKMALVVAAGALLVTPVAAATRGELSPAVTAVTPPPAADARTPSVARPARPSAGSRPVRLADTKDRVVLIDCWRS
jgi:hypothetical protein